MLGLDPSEMNERVNGNVSSDPLFPHLFEKYSEELKGISRMIATGTGRGLEYV